PRAHDEHTSCAPPGPATTTPRVLNDHRPCRFVPGRGAAELADHRPGLLHARACREQPAALRKDRARDREALRPGLALAEDDFGKRLADSSVVIHGSRADRFERKVGDRFERLARGDASPAYVEEKLTEPRRIHARLRPRRSTPPCPKPRARGRLPRGRSRASPDTG